MAGCLSLTRLVSFQISLEVIWDPQGPSANSNQRLPLPEFNNENKNVVATRNNIDKVIIEELQKILKIDNISIKAQLRFLTINGSYEWFEIHCNPLWDENKKSKCTNSKVVKGK